MEPKKRVYHETFHSPWPAVCPGMPAAGPSLFGRHQTCGIQWATLLMGLGAAVMEVVFPLVTVYVVWRIYKEINSATIRVKQIGDEAVTWKPR